MPGLLPLSDESEVSILQFSTQVQLRISEVTATDVDNCMSLNLQCMFVQ